MQDDVENTNNKILSSSTYSVDKNTSFIDGSKETYRINNLKQEKTTTSSLFCSNSPNDIL